MPSPSSGALRPNWADIPKKTQRQQAFTLLEMLVALAVLGILLSIAVMSGAQWQRQLQADNFLAELTSDFNISRTKTLSTGEVRRVRLVSATSYVVERESSPNSGTWQTLKTATSPRNILDMANTLARQYKFSTRGFVDTYDTAGQLTTSTSIKAVLGSGAKTITVTALGIARRQ